MTEIQPVNLGHKFDPPGVQLFKWEHMAPNDTGTTLDVAQYDKISVQVEGAFDRAVVALEGSIDGEHWYALIDRQDNHMRFDSSAMADVGQRTRYLRPIVVDGVATDVTVFALCWGIR